MKFKRMAVAFMLSAFFISNSFADSEFSVDDGTYGIKYISRDKKTFNYLNNKPLGEVVYFRDLKSGQISSSVHKIGCFYTHCIVYKKKVSDGDKPKENMKVFDISGSELKDPDQKDADELGMTLADYKKMVKEDNDYGKIWQQIQLKHAEQYEKEQKAKKDRNYYKDLGGNNGKGKYILFGYQMDGGTVYSENPEYLCQKYFTQSYVRPGDGTKKLFISDVQYFRDINKCVGYFRYDEYGRHIEDQYGSFLIQQEIDISNPSSSSIGSCSNGTKKIKGSNGTFSVLCTEKQSPKNDKPNVSDLSGGASAGGGNAPGGVSSGASNAGGSTSAGNSGNSGGGSGVNSNSGSSSNNSSSSNGSGTGAGTGTSSGTGSGTGLGNGEGNGENEGDFKGIPKYGEPDWGNLKSDGGFGNFSPSNAFSTGGSCMADVQLDMGEFGNHTLPMSFLCQVLEKLRYVFISMAYLYSAILVFKTVNSLKG